MPAHRVARLLVCCAWLLLAPLASLGWPQSGAPLPGTKKLELDKPLDEVMVDGIDRFALREIAEGVAKRASYWKRNYSSPAAYEQSIAANREHLREILGA
ncbi:MAG: hypothetical protein ACK5EA_29655, partial [Planctomycetaceae bacterium]